MKGRKARVTVRRAFTLLEVLMVIVILGLIATVVVTQIGKTEERAKRDLAKQQIQMLAQKIEIFRLHCGRFPTEDEGLLVLLEQPDDEELEDKWAGPYVKPEQLKDPWGSDFVYRYPGEVNEGSFDIVSPGPDRDEGGEDDIGNYASVD